jgi:hypothetical protein
MTAESLEKIASIFENILIAKIFILQLSVATHTCIFSTWKTEAGGS